MKYFLVFIVVSAVVGSAGYWANTLKSSLKTKSSVALSGTEPPPPPDHPAPPPPPPPEYLKS